MMKKYPNNKSNFLRVFLRKLKYFYIKSSLANSKVMMRNLINQEKLQRMDAKDLVDPYVNITHPEFE